MTRLPALVALRSASFRRTPTAAPIFANTSFTLPSPTPAPAEKWAVLGPSKSTFLSILRGSLHASPPNARTYPALSAVGKWPYNAIQLVSFGGGSTQGMLKGGTGGDGYVSARYETLRERFDQTLREWLEASIESRLNPYETATHDRLAQEAAEAAENKRLLERVVKELKLEELLAQAVMTLSNGQSRRARIAQALLKRPEILLVDEPFMGLDPKGHALLSTLLDRVSTPVEGAHSTPVVLGLRPQDAVPTWSTHLAYVDGDCLVSAGPKTDVVEQLRKEGKKILLEGSSDTVQDKGVVEKAWAGIGSLTTPPPPKKLAEPLVEMEKVRIAYYDNVILDNFTWTIRRGEKWGLFGPNGSGKTTLTALLTSDHPLSYSQPVKHFGRSRLPEPGKRGVSVFEIQSRIGLSSPEVHSFFPRHLTLLNSIRSGFAPTPLTAPSISPDQKAHLESVLREFEDLVPAGWGQKFGEIDMSTQRLVLFLRATVTRRDLVIFDEAFSGMKGEVRERCFAFLDSERGWDGDKQAMVVVSHVSEEVPRGVERWVRLGERGGGEGAVFGEF
ncbi:P-loop containing nucleoside triphosphate hydrolase protein [Sphaerosporella brunnea]|uniref:P-loop containing nucleoside triphosphate hydrolase protein n=1 Tax=Sphaerosporella brunnea TaxID=1250544 RepID=A0A5J5EC99_9PEZI|nr:P-loop containing nucleoside triphosphate hydrolase protein [Sphaerosporella brunnea]